MQNPKVKALTLLIPIQNVTQLFVFDHFRGYFIRSLALRKNCWSVQLTLSLLIKI